MRTVALVLASALVAGCDDTLFGVPIGGDGGPVEPAYEVSFRGVEDMWAAHCQACHPAVNAFVLDDVVADVAAGGGAYLQPGDPGASMFWRLIAAERIDGDPRVMPDGTPTGLRPAEREHVRLWILDGAPIVDQDGSDGDDEGEG